MARKRVKDVFKELIKEQRTIKQIRIRLSEQIVPIEQELLLLKTEALKLDNEASLIENKIDAFLNAGGEDDGGEDDGEENS